MSTGSIVLHNGSILPKVEQRSRKELTRLYSASLLRGPLWAIRFDLEAQWRDNMVPMGHICNPC